MMQGTKLELQVNKLARRNRHMKVFSEQGFVLKVTKSLSKLALTPFVLLGRVGFLSDSWRLSTDAFSFLKEILPIAPKKRLFFQALMVSLVIIAVTSVTPAGSFVASSQIYTSEYIDSYSVPGNVLVTDEDGYLVKINPQTGDSNRIGLTDFAVHTVESGESLSVIAARYEVNVKTIMWENGMSNPNSLRIGQKVVIPPVDGINYKVKGGDSLEKIATKYDVSVDAIAAQNGLTEETIRKGQELFLPGAEPLYPVIASNISTANYRNSVVTRNDRTYSAENSSASPAAGRPFIFPTVGSITQGYHGGHYALDIADSSRPPVWAAASGTVIEASQGTWGGGYGGHVKVDHGDGLVSLYAHLGSVSVSEGQWVNQGDVLGPMGNTGRVYGATGIHLHWEVSKDGVKQNPYNYY